MVSWLRIVVLQAVSTMETICFVDKPQTEVLKSPHPMEAEQSKPVLWIISFIRGTTSSQEGSWNSMHKSKSVGFSFFSLETTTRLISLYQGWTISSMVSFVGSLRYRR